VIIACPRAQRNLLAALGGEQVRDKTGYHRHISSGPLNVDVAEKSGCLNEVCVKVAGAPLTAPRL